jgi:hypothetical protein
MRSIGKRNSVGKFPSFSFGLSSPTYLDCAGFPIFHGEAIGCPFEATLALGTCPRVLLAFLELFW